MQPRHWTKHRVSDSDVTAHRRRLADEVAGSLRKHFMIDVDLTGSIGKRYRRQDEVGTPLCVTIDFDSLEDGAVTIRERDTTQQERVSIDRLEQVLSEKLGF